MKLNNLDMLRLLPVFMQDDENFKALAYAINDEFRLLHAQTEAIALYKNIDTLPENIIDELAEQFSVTEYNKTYDINIKRNLVRNCFATHKRRGTVASVEDVCAKIFGDALVEEWFEYGGDPYHFKVYTENLNVSDTMIADFRRVINETKNIRSHLDELIVSAINSVDLRVGMALDLSDDFAIETEEYNNVNVTLYIEDGDLMCSNAHTPIIIALKDLSTSKVYGFIYDDEEQELFLVEHQIIPSTVTEYLTLTDTTHFEDLTITSDGVIHGGFVKVSDIVPIYEHLKKGVTLSYYNVSGGEITGELKTAEFPQGDYTISRHSNGALIAFDGFVLAIVSYDGNPKYGAITFSGITEPGIYLYQGNYFLVHSLTINDFVGVDYKVFVDNGELFYELVEKGETENA